MTDSQQARFEQAKLSPAAVYDAPAAVLQDPALSDPQRLAVLRSWQEDAQELATAEAENMAGGEPNLLPEILAAIARLEGRHG